MNSQHIMFYMNNPCVVIREVTEDFSEIKLDPKFAQDITADQWCTACMIGGTSSHTCGSAQEIIDCINDSEASIIVMVENRLLHETPIEATKIKILCDKIANLLDLESEKKSVLGNLVFNVETAQSTIKNLISMAENHEINLQMLNDDVAKAKDRINEYSLHEGVNVKSGVFSKNISGDDYKDLVRSKIMLEKLKAGGVDNWEWYDESAPNYDELELMVFNEINQRG